MFRFLEPLRTSFFFPLPNSLQSFLIENLFFFFRNAQILHQHFSVCKLIKSSNYTKLKVTTNSMHDISCRRILLSFQNKFFLHHYIAHFFFQLEFQSKVLLWLLLLYNCFLLLVMTIGFFDCNLQLNQNNIVETKQKKKQKTKMKLKRTFRNIYLWFKLRVSEKWKISVYSTGWKMI